MGMAEKILEQQRDAAMEHMREHAEEHRRIEELVLGPSNRRGGRRVTELIKFGDDYLVKVEGGVMFGESGKAWWMFVVNGRASSALNPDMESAMLHLIATRYDPNPNSNHMWAAAAARVLGLSEQA